jgi:RNA polymerase sigma-70 factor, ECF subfamily
MEASVVAGAAAQRSEPEQVSAAGSFSAFVAAEQDRAVALAYHLTGGDRELAKEVAQEAFIKAYRALPGFRGEATLRTWFTRILMREAAGARRRQQWRERLFSWWWPGPESGEGGPERLAASPRLHEPLRQRIADAVLSLSEGQRQVFVLVHLEGMTVEETARILEKAPGTVKSHLHRALVSLRAQLAGALEEVGDEA